MKDFNIYQTMNKLRFESELFCAYKKQSFFRLICGNPDSVISGKIRILLMFLALFFISGCTVNKKVIEMGNSTSSRKVLIATENTDFKKEVTNKLIQKLGTQDWYFRIIGLNQLNETDISQYNAILLVCKVCAGKIQSKANSFIQKEKTNPKLILFLTSGSEKSLPNSVQAEMKGVDAVTSASKISYEDKMADQLVSMLLKKF